MHNFTFKHGWVPHDELVKIHAFDSDTLKKMRKKKIYRQPHAENVANPRRCHRALLGMASVTGQRPRRVENLGADGAGIYVTSADHQVHPSSAEVLYTEAVHTKMI